MRILKVKRVPKRPYARCAACGMTDNWKGTEVLATNQIILLGAKRTEVWLCDKHLEQLKEDVASL